MTLNMIQTYSWRSEIFNKVFLLCLEYIRGLLWPTIPPLAYGVVNSLKNSRKRAKMWNRGEIVKFLALTIFDTSMSFRPFDQMQRDLHESKVFEILPTKVLEAFKKNLITFLDADAFAGQKCSKRAISGVKCEILVKHREIVNFWVLIIFDSSMSFHPFNQSKVTCMSQMRSKGFQRNHWQHSKRI